MLAINQVISASFPDSSLGREESGNEARNVYVHSTLTLVLIRLGFSEPLWLSYSSQSTGQPVEQVDSPRLGTKTSENL